jgi:hypothetical protein
MPLVDHVEVAPVGAAGFQSLDDVGAVLFRALFGRELRRVLLHPVGEVGLEPVPALGADAQIAAGLAVDPGGQINPLVDLIEALAVPGQVFGSGGR